jgi:hypothetical protein
VVYNVYVIKKGVIYMAGKTYSGKKGEGKQSVVPRTMDHVRALLSGRHEDKFREPITQREEREYVKVWKRGGKGFTKKTTTKAIRKKKNKAQKQARKNNR